MPELPEVEVTRRSLADRLIGARIESVRFGKPLRWPLGCAPGLLAGRTVRDLRRRGKYLLLDLDVGLLLMHLGMSGSLNLQPEPPPPGAHDHFDLLTDRGTLRLRDPRRFGAVVYAEGQAAPAARRLLDQLGVEPFSDEFTARGFHAGLQQRATAVKHVLLSGDLVVGVGNIYACESLFYAGIHPALRARLVSRPRAAKLHAAIIDVLQRAVTAGGSTLRDFSYGCGEAGHFQHETTVYDRANLPCKVCATPIRLIRQGQRSTYFCPVCQRR